MSIKNRLSRIGIKHTLPNRGLADYRKNQIIYLELYVGGGFDMTKVTALRDCSNAAGTRAQKVGDHGLAWRSFVH